jgi:hypothetical protein
VDKAQFSLEPMIKMGDSLFNWSNVKPVQTMGASDDPREFNFIPSVTWLCSRYPKPEKSRMTARIGGALADSGGEGGGEGGSNGLSVPAASEPLIKVLVRSQRFRNSFQIR